MRHIKCWVCAEKSPVRTFLESMVDGGGCRCGGEPTTLCMHMYKELASSGDLSIEFRSNNNSNNNNFRLFSLSGIGGGGGEPVRKVVGRRDEVQYYVSEQVSKLEPVPGLPSVPIALRQLLDILSTHITGMEARPDLLFFYFFCFLLLLLLLLGIVPENSMV